MSHIPFFIVILLPIVGVVGMIWTTNKRAWRRAERMEQKRLTRSFDDA